MTILIKPIITEKSMADAARSIFTFQVLPSATKHQIRELVTELFSVHVTKVNTTIIKPTAKRTGRRRLASTTATKKIARVWLKKGETISLFDLKEE